MIKTPMDIQKKNFSRAFRGFEEVEVKSFLDEIASYCTQILKENNLLKDQNRNLELRTQELIQREKTVNETLSVVQKISDEMKESTRKECNNLLSQAKNSAKELALQKQEELEKTKTEIEFYKKKKQDIVQSLTQFLKDQISQLQTSAMTDTKVNNTKTNALDC